MKALKTTLSIAELQKTISLWKSRKITDSTIPKLLRLYLGIPAYMNTENVYPVENFYDINVALAFKNTQFLAEAVKRCGSFGIVTDKNLYGMKFFYSPIWHEEGSAEELSGVLPGTLPGKLPMDNNIYNINP